MNAKSSGRRFTYTIRQQLILFCLAIIIIPYCVTGAVVYKEYVRSMHDEARQYILQYGEQVSGSLDAYFEQINDLTLRPYYDAALMEILRQRAKELQAGESSYMRSTSLSTIQLLLMSAGFTRRDFLNVSLTTADGYTRSAVDGNANTKSTIPRDLEAYAPYQTPHGFYLLPPKREVRNGVPQVSSAVVRALHDPDSGNVLGYLRIDLNQRMFESILSDSANKYGNLLYVANAFGDVYYPVDQQGGALPFVPGARVTLEGKEYTLYQHASADSSLTVYQLASDAAILSGAADLSRFTLFVAFGVAVVAIAATIAYSYNTTRHLHDLAEKMRLVQEGDFDVRVSSRRRDEIGRLCEGFNNMVWRIRHLIVENYQTRLLRQEAEFKALQRQIDPHFLYNTLELINMMALEKREYAISDTVTSLGRMLRYTVSNERAMCPLREELQFLQAYFSILKMRNGERFNWEIECSPAFLDCMMPRLSLQPLVENAFIHGLQADRGFIAVRVGEEKGRLVVSVQDDGVGMDEKALQHIRALMRRHGQTAVPGGHALDNINQRLALAYGEAYDIQVSSSRGDGTQLILRFPQTQPDRKEPRDPGRRDADAPDTVGG